MMREFLTGVFVFMVGILLKFCIPEGDYIMAIDPLTLAAIGAGLGLLRSRQQGKAAERQRQLAANTALFRPFTGLTPQVPGEVDTLGNVLQGALAGGQFGGALEAQEAQKTFNERLLTLEEAKVAGGDTGGFGETSPDFFRALRLQQESQRQPGLGFQGFNQGAGFKPFNVGG